MRGFLQLCATCLAFLICLGNGLAADAPASAATSAADKELATKAAAAAVVAADNVERRPDFLEHLVDSVLSLFDIESSGNTTTHYAISGLLLVLALLARAIVTRLVFPGLRRIASKTDTTFDDRLLPALEAPVAALVMVIGMLAAVKVLKLSSEADFYISSGARVAMSLAVFWVIWRALSPGKSRILVNRHRKAKLT